MKKIQVPVLGGLRKKVNITGSGLTLQGYENATLTPAQLAALLGVVPAAPTLPNTQAKTSPAWLTVGPGLQGGGALIGNVPLLLAEGTLPGAAPLYDSDAEDYGMMLSLPGPTGSRGLQGFPIPGQDGEDGMDGFPGVAGAAGATGPAGAAGASGVPGPALWFEADQGEDPLQLMGITGNTGPTGATGAAGAAGPALWRDADDGEDSPSRDIPGNGDPNHWTGLSQFLSGYLLVNNVPVQGGFSEWLGDPDDPADPPLGFSLPDLLQGLQISYGTCTFTLTGCTTSPTGTGIWCRIGNVVLLFVPGITGTSNSTAMTLTGLPAGIQPVRTQNLAVVYNGVINATAASTGNAYCFVSAASGTLTFVWSGSTTGFTGAGTKGVNSPFTVPYLLN